MNRKWYVLAVAILALLTLVGPPAAGAATIAAGSDFAVAVKTDGTLWMWGDNTNGLLGNGSTGGNVTAPAPVGSATTWSAVAAGSDFAVALGNDGTLWMWGDNTKGLLGNNTTGGNVTAPAQVGSATTWSAVAAGSDFIVALMSDGSLWTWGDNTNGQLGRNGGSLTAPNPVGGVTTWSAVAAGSDFVVAVGTDGTLWTWGDNSIGQLGLGTTGGNVTAPAQLGSATTWSAVAAGSDFVVALMSDGSLWAWGDNSKGQLGDGTTTSRIAPEHIGTATTWTTVAAGSDFTIALMNGPLWAWGDNSVGQLGDGTTTSRIAPEEIGTAVGWTAIAAGSDFTMGLMADGSLWTWGDNGSGQLGNGTTTNATAPVEILSSGFPVTLAVMSTVPANNATNVNVGSSIQAVFSEAMNATSITTATFTMSGGVTGSVTYDASTNTATFTPSTGLATNTVYTATITTGVTGANGDTLSANYTWSFITGSKKSGHCFIATAAYGSYLDPHVAVLRAFRDAYLLTNRAGRLFVDLYYRCSPPLAHLIARHPALRTMTRWALTPIVYGVMHPFALGFIPPLSFLWIWLEKGRRRRRKIRKGRQQ